MLTMKTALEQVREQTGEKIKKVYVDKGYRGKRHHPEGVEICINGVGKVSQYV